MMSRSIPPLLVLGCVLAAALGIAGDAEPPEASPDPAEQPVRVHSDPDELVNGAADAVRAYLLEDSRAMRAALDRIERSTRRLDPTRDEDLGEGLVRYEQAFHETLDRAREYSIKGRLEDAFNQFVWTQRACVTCHGIAREQGLMEPGPVAPASRP
jgi:hypothetical protein